MEVSKKKPDEPRAVDQNEAPISLSNLETNKLE